MNTSRVQVRYTSIYRFLLSQFGTYFEKCLLIPLKLTNFQDGLLTQSGNKLAVRLANGQRGGRVCKKPHVFEADLIVDGKMNCPEVLQQSPVPSLHLICLVRWRVEIMDGYCHTVGVSVIKMDISRMNHALDSNYYQIPKCKENLH